MVVRCFRESPQCHLISFLASFCSVSGLGWFELQRQDTLSVPGEVAMSLTGNCSFPGSQSLSLPYLADTSGEAIARSLGTHAVVWRGTDYSSLHGPLFIRPFSDAKDTEQKLSEGLVSGG